MSYLVLARKYRPQTFDEVVDQPHVTQTLKNAIAQNRVAHAVVFCGPRGTGKTTIARILAKSINCIKGPTAAPCNQCRSCGEITSGNAVDVFEIDGASNNSVDQIRELRENLKYLPAHSRSKIYIIDEVHMLSAAAFNALLKTLEEPPAHVMFLFATTEPHKIPLTILSRCQRHDLRRIRTESIVKHLDTLCRLEGFDVPESSLMALAREAGGSMRDAMSLLDQVMVCTGETTGSPDIFDLLGIVDRKQLFDISQAVLDGNAARFLDIVDDLYDRGHDMKRLFIELIAHFRDLLVAKIGTGAHRLIDLSEHEIKQLQQQAEGVTESHISQILDILFREEAKIRFAVQPKLAFESVYLRVFHTKPILAIHELIEKLDHLRRDVTPDCSTALRDRHQLPRDGNLQSAAGETSEKAADTTGGHPDPALSPAEAPSADTTGQPTVHAAWQTIQQAISDAQPSLAAHLINSRIRAQTEDQLEIELCGSSFNLNMVRRPKNMEIITKACRQYFNKTLSISFHINADRGSEKPQKKNDIEIKNKALHHPLVSDAIDIFDGKIVEVKILKEDNQ